jgi:hypothetical protein
MNHWEVVTDSWQQFYEHWHNSFASSKFRNSFLYISELGVNPEGKSLLPFNADDTSEGRIVITESYNDMFRRILYLRKVDKGNARGVVLTGQPGTGAFL